MTSVKKILGFAVGPVGSAALGFLSLPLIAWKYPVEDVGRIAMLQLVFSLSTTLFGLGLDQAYIREYHESDQKPALLKAAILPGLVLLLACLGLCMVNPEMLSYTLFSVSSWSISLMVAACLISVYLSRFISLILRMQGNGLAFSMSQVIPKAIFVFVLLIYLAFSFGFNIKWLVFAHTTSVVFALLIFIWNTRSECVMACKQHLDIKKLKAMLHFGAPLAISALAYWGLTAMDRIFLRNYSSYNELGIYSVSTSFAGVAAIFQGVFSTVWAPLVYKWHTEGVNTKKVDEITMHVLTVVVIIFSITGALSWVVCPMLPPKYEKVQYILTSCIACPLFYTLSETTVVGLGIMRKSTWAMVASIITLVVNLLLNYLLVPIFGAVGAAIATAASFWLFLVVRTEFSRKAWRKIPRIKLYTGTFICLMMSVFTAVRGSNDRYLVIVLWVLLGVIWGIISRDQISLAVSKTIKKKILAVP